MVAAENSLPSVKREVVFSSIDDIVNIRCIISPNSLVMPLTPEVLTYLQDDGTLVLPEGSQPEMTYERGPMPEEPAQDWDHCETSGSVVEVCVGAKRAPTLVSVHDM